MKRRLINLTVALAVCASAGATMVSFCDYYPVAVGNWWNTMPDMVLTSTEAYSSRSTVNGFDVWERTWYFRSSWSDPTTQKWYEVLVDGVWYVVKEEDAAALQNLPTLTEEFVSEYLTCYETGVTATLPSGKTCTAYVGSVTDLLRDLADWTAAWTLEYPDGLALAFEDAVYPETAIGFFARGVGTVALAIGMPDSELLVRRITPGAIVGNDGCVVDCPGESALWLTSPNGAEKWLGGSTQTFTWAADSAKVGTDVRLALHKGSSFVTWVARRAANDGALNWLVPRNIEGADDYRIRVQAFDDPTVRDFSDGGFTLLPAPLTVTAPARGAVWPAGTVRTITWTADAATVGDSVRIGLHQGKAFVAWLVRRTDNDGACDWIVPSALPAAADYRIRVQSYSDAFVRDVTPMFEITP
ncbi:MAG TPA: Ser-Thr-rich GPI-anchored membrane family protein [Candidatus Hydrogenedentes bacterium]|nr:Ser-Thr-rich GPI-anchored membrane family protein [Candidatus Hydrogenedentota bacterium]